MHGRTRVLAIIPSLAVVVALVFVFAFNRGDEPESLTLDQFQAEIDDGNVVTAELREESRVVVGELADGTSYEVGYVGEFADELTIALTEAEPTIRVSVDAQRSPLWRNILLTLLPIFVLVGAFVILLRYAQGAGSKTAQFGKAKARRRAKNEASVTFADVAGADEAVEELREIRDFLENPDRFAELGATIPKGVLLLGPPGTGKTLLARAVAGEAGVPFFTMSGSDFVEMFVGVGASRVRNLFKQAKEEAPAIIFVDEIDAVGRHRGAGLGGGHDEREQTLNQMLVEMDGFDTNSGVIMIAATNRPDILDPALLRPGRFDRHIVVDKPDLVGRRKILDVHARSKPLAFDVDLDIVAKRTPGFTGADLQNLLNEAALLAARDNSTQISVDHITLSMDRVLAGAERSSRVMSDADKRITAYHEAGHALVGHVLPNTDPVHKVTILPRGRALGWTLSLPETESHFRTRSSLLDELAYLLGGRTAEEIVFGDTTTGAANDIERATDIARSMVTQFGMSDRLGLRKFGKHDGEVFLGKDVNHEPDYSDAVAAQIDAEVQAFIDSAHGVANDVITLHRPTLNRLAEELIERETLESDDLAVIFADLETSPPDSVGVRQTEAAGVRAVDTGDDII